MEKGFVKLGLLILLPLVLGGLAFGIGMMLWERVQGAEEKEMLAEETNRVVGTHDSDEEETNTESANNSKTPESKIYPCDIVKQNPMCTMEFDPQICKAQVNNETFEGTGSNKCKASLELLANICKKHTEIPESIYNSVICSKTEL